MSKNKWNCGIAICAFNRPDYFKDCLESISLIPEVALRLADVFVFCDGGEFSESQKIKEITERHPCVSDVIIQDRNLGIPNHMHYIRETMLETMSYARFMFVEEDVVVSPYYFRVMNGALDVYEKFDASVEVINSCDVCLEPLYDKLRKRDNFSDALSHLNNFVMKNTAWAKIKPLMQEYIDRFIKPIECYRDIDHWAVLDWAKEKIKVSTVNEKIFRRTLKCLTSSQDSITNVALRLKNLRYVCSYVNRVKNIGESGYHYEKGYFKKQQLDKMILDVLPEDENEITTIWDMDFYCRINL